MFESIGRRLDFSCAFREMLRGCTATVLVCAALLTLPACSDNSGGSAEQSGRDETREMIAQLEVDGDIDGLIAYLVEQANAGDIQFTGGAVRWSPTQSRARDAITQMILKNPSTYERVSASLVPSRRSDGFWNDSGAQLASALLKHIKQEMLAELQIKGDVDGLIAFFVKLIKTGDVQFVGGVLQSHMSISGARDAHNAILRLTRQDASAHARADARLVAIRDGAESESVRKFATGLLTSMNKDAYFARQDTLLRRALASAGLDPNTDLVEPPDPDTGFVAPKTMKPGSEVDVVFLMWMRPANAAEAGIKPGLWHVDGRLRGRSRAEIDAYFDGISDVGLYIYESSRQAGHTAGETSDGSKSYGSVIQGIYYVYRITLANNEVAGMRINGPVSSPGAPIALDQNCNYFGGLPLNDPFVIRER